MNTNPGTKKRKRNLLTDIEIIANQAADSELSNHFLKSVKQNSGEISTFLSCNSIQAVLFSIICNLNCTNKSVSIEQLTHWTGCPPIVIAGFMNDLEVLRRKNIIRKAADDKKTDDTSLLSGASFSVNPCIFTALRNETPVKATKTVISDNYGLVKAIADLVTQRNEDVITFREMWREFATIETTYADMEFLKALRKAIRDKKERLLFFHLCAEYYNGNLNNELHPLVCQVTPDKREQFQLRLLFSKGNSQLSASGLIELRQIIFRGEKEACLTDKAVEMLTRDIGKIKISTKEEKAPDIIPATSLKAKALFFTPEEQEQQEFLAQILMPDQFKKLTGRLEKSGMKTGVAVLFHGSPGTGKTESVIQLARQTGRDLLQVNISETKSKWYGESEKRIKEIFDRYRTLAGESEIAPILFFNEADAIFGSRKQVGVSLVDQTENTIQNILLQEMEDLKGILVATTNMTQNFDKAFDRRFLYKIRFEKPTADARAQIWKSKIPTLTNIQASQLAATHDLSGGQIDNVARKFLMSHILHGQLPSQQKVESWCQEENPRKETRKIGY